MHLSMNKVMAWASLIAVFIGAVLIFVADLLVAWNGHNNKIYLTRDGYTTMVIIGGVLILVGLVSFGFSFYQRHA